MYEVSFTVHSNSDFSSDVVLHITAKSDSDARRKVTKQYLKDGFFVKNLKVKMLNNTK